MSTRISNHMMTTQLQQAYGDNLYRLLRSENQVSTGKRLFKPSDDPANVARDMQLRTSLNENAQYRDNIDSALSFLDTTDSALGTIDNILLRVKELAIKAANGTNSTEGVETAIADELEQLNEHLKTTANTTYGSKYIFGGSNVTQAPSQGDLWVGNENDLDMEVGDKVSLPYNLLTKDFFVGTEPYQKDIQITAGSGLNQVTADNLQPGTYSIGTAVPATNTSTGLISVDCYSKQGATSLFALTPSNSGATDKNASIEMTVSGINVATGEVTYAYDAHVYDLDGAYHEYTGEIPLNSSGPSQTLQIGTDPSDSLVLSLQAPSDISNLTVGDREVFGVTAVTAAGTGQQVTVSYTDGSGTPQEYSFVFDSGGLDGKTTDLKFFSEDGKGQSFDSTVSLSVGTLDTASPAASFTTRTGLFDMMEDLIGNVTGMDSDKIETNIGQIEDKLDELLALRSTAGAKTNRLELQQTRLESNKVTYTSQLSNVEDIDIAEAITNFMEQINVYQACLGVGARIIQPTLVSFLS